MRTSLRRRADERVIAGVAGGLADRFGVPVAVGRIGFLLCAIAFGLGVLRATGDPYGPNRLSERIALLGATGVFAYLLIWFAVPREDQPTSAARRLAAQVPGAPAWVGVVLFVIGGSILGSQIGLWQPGAIWAFLMIAAGVLLFRKDAERRGGPSVAETHEADVVPTALETGAGQGTSAVAPIPVRRTRRARSPLGWIVFGVMLLSVGGAAILASLGVAQPTLQQYPALAVLVLSVGLLVGSVVGHARWLILPALVLVPILLATSLVHVPLEGGYGGRFVRPTLAEAGGTYRVTTGDLNVDLTLFRGKDVVVPVTGSTALGSIQVIVPYDARVVTRASTGYGQVWVDGRVSDGLDVSIQRIVRPAVRGGPTVVLRLATGIGDVWVDREWLSKKQKRKLGIEVSP